MHLRSTLLLASLSTLPLAACGDDKDADDTTSGSPTGDPTTDVTGSTGSTGPTDPTTSGPTTDVTTGPTDPTTTGPTDPTTGPEPTTTPDPTTTGEDTTTTTGETTTTSDDTTGAVGPGWASDVYSVLNPMTNCGCHMQGAGGMVLGDEMTSFTEIVGVASEDVPAMPRVTPGDHENSYLWHKINGTHLDVGGAGSQMPLGAPPLPQATIDLVAEWIDGGANP